MRTLLHKFLQGKTKWSFQEADLTEKTEELKNPARGWYEIYPFQVEEKPDLRSLSWCATGPDTIALVLLDIGAYREMALDNKALGNIRNILRFFAENQYDVILRVVYDRHGKAPEREPFFFEQVKGHVKQLLPIVKEFQQNIFVFQGMLIGNWGEMHTSRFLAPAKLRELWSLLQKDAPEVYFAVRKPSQWRLLHPECCGRKELQIDKMGLFDDAIFGSENHLGTFGTTGKESASWDREWKKKDELDFEEQLCRQVPNGGEAICGEQYPENGTPAETVATLQKMHITYLNRAYDENILKLWKDWRWEEAGVWQNVSVYDYIGRHLGYRFWIKAVEATLMETSAEKVAVSITVENVGFANLYHEAEVYLECEDSNGGRHSQKLDCDMRAWESGSIQVLSGEIELMNCKIYLLARHKQDGRRIYFANQTGRGGRVLVGQVKDVRIRG